MLLLHWHLNLLVGGLPIEGILYMLFGSDGGSTRSQN